MKRSRVSFDSKEANVASSESVEDVARRVLFSDTLTEKLRPAEGRPVLPEDGKAPSEDFTGVTPGRPAELRLAKGDRTRPPLPKAPSLVNDESRGILLHFFANHELLAAELMALALLKFPDAPGAFRSGLADTLKEEQRHARWYIGRMKECGVAFGQYPANRFFWDAVSTMETPLDYVSRLSLTFEQANLDYSRHYARVLEEAGDEESAAILRRVHEDEISHVGYGLRWFRRWKNEGDSDWTALEKQLSFPLSPSRAKGPQASFSAEGRHRAGFDEDYIKKLSLFERSKGRTPNVFHFNPEAENRIAALPAAYDPPARIASVVEDLEILPAFLARQDDVVLMRRPPSLEHLERLKASGFTLPEFVALDARGRLAKDGLLSRRKVHEVRPWAKAPDLPERFSDLVSRCTGRSPLAKWESTDEKLFSKAHQAETFRHWMGLSFLCRSAADLAVGAEELLERGHENGLLKQPFSTAGGGNRKVALRETIATMDSKRSDPVAVKGGILLEPLHDRVFDFSVQYSVDGDEIQFLGPVEQLIAPSGGYRGSVCVNKFCQGMDPELARFLMNEALPTYRKEGALATSVREWAAAAGYAGPLGVDAYVYRDRDGGLRHRPICEINVRYTMGRVAMEIRRQIAPGHALKFEILKATQRESFPAPLLDDSGKIRGGALVLNEVRAGSRFAAQITVAEDRRELQATPDSLGENRK
ncbi:MAG: DUF455 family protein [Verrucomicrobiales bacterium]